MSEEIDPGTVVLVALAELRGMRPDAWTEGSLFEQAVRLDRLNALIGLAREAAEQIEESLVPTMEEDIVVLPGVGRLVRDEKTSSTWRSGNSAAQMRDDLATAVAQSVAVDVATGEVDPTKRNVAVHALRVAFRAIPSFSSLNKAGRDELGLHIGDYRSYSTHYKVTLEPEA